MSEETKGIVDKTMPEGLDARGKFAKGNKLGGRPKGARNRLAESFLNDMLQDWEVHGREAIVRVREEDPSTYLRTVAKIIPDEVKIDADIKHSWIGVLTAIEADIRTAGDEAADLALEERSGSLCH